MTKKIASPLPSNEDQPTKGTMNVYPNPPGRPDPMEHDNRFPDLYSEGVRKETRQDRQDMLHRIFDSMEPASAQAKEEISELFEHGKEGDFETHTPTLMRKNASVKEEASLGEEVRRRIGRF